MNPERKEILTLPVATATIECQTLDVKSSATELGVCEETVRRLVRRKVFRGARTQITEVQIPLYFQGLSRWWAQQDLNLRPDDYESPALTAELWARLTAS